MNIQLVEDAVINYKRGHISLETVMATVEAYSSASNNGNAIVSGALPQTFDISEFRKEYEVYCNEKSTPGYTFGWHASNVIHFLEERYGGNDR